MKSNLKDKFTFNKEMLVIAFYGGFVALAISGTLSKLFSIIGIEYFQFQESEDIQMTLVTLLFAIIVAPFVEELLFRGALFYWLLKTIKNNILSIILCSLIFGILHMNIVQSSAAFLYGIVFSIIVLYTDSLVPAMISHFILNVGSSVINLITRSNVEYTYQIEYIFLVSVYSVILITSIYIKKHGGIKEYFMLF